MALADAIGAADLAHALRGGVGRGWDLCALLVQEQVIVAKMRPRDGPVQVLGKRTSTVRRNARSVLAGVESLDHPLERVYTTKSDGIGIGPTIGRPVIEIHQGQSWATLTHTKAPSFSSDCRLTERRRHRRSASAILLQGVP
jgi:hypothetical protein